MESQEDHHFIRQALEEAKAAAECGEIPVGAVVVHHGEIVGRGRNRREATQDPIAHAEVLALQEASHHLKSWRLEDCTLYVTLEPCIMCAGAILQARVGRIVYGCKDPKGGAVASLYRLCADRRLNHQPEVTGEVLESDCARILTEFFNGLRMRNVNSEWQIANGK